MPTLSENLQTIKDATDIIRGKLDMPTDVIGDVADAVKVPTGNIEITQNGTNIDVADYATASVDVEPDLSEYFNNRLHSGDSSAPGWAHLVKKLPDTIYVDPSIDNLNYGFTFYFGSSLPFIDTSNIVTMACTFYNCQNVQTFPQYNTSNVTDMREAFRFNPACVNFPVLDLSKVTNLYKTWDYNSNLSNDSLNNILYMLTNATAYITQGTDMTLKYVGLTQTQAETCKTLSNYQAFINAGWTTGYDE